MKKRVLSAILSLCMLIGLIGMIPVTAEEATTEEWAQSAATAFDGNGDGSSEENAYQIANAAQLAYFAKCVNSGTANNPYASAHYKLTADIDLDGKLWAPIGSGDYANNVFTGVFDGNGHKISNMEWDGKSYGQDQSSEAIGLFGVIGANVTIKNLATRIGNRITLPIGFPALPAISERTE